MINIDLNGIPPNPADIEIERQTAQTTLARLKIRRIMFFAISLGILIGLGWFGMLTGPSLAARSILIGLVVFVVVLIIGPYDMLIEKPIDLAENWERGLQPISLEQCPEILDLCIANPVLAEYQIKVALDGRQFIRAEYHAMDTWHEQVRKQAKVSKQKAACAQLSEPLVLVGIS